MTITYPLTMPSSPAPVDSVFGAAFNNTTNLSLNGTRQVIRRPADLIVYEWTLPPMLRAQAAAWQAFGMMLQGSFGRFRAGDPDAKSPLGVASGSIVVTGAGQVGNSITLDGNQPSTANIFRAGDWISIEDRLYMVVIDAPASDGIGNFTIDISPPIPAGSAPANATSVGYTNPTGIFRLVDDRIDWRADKISRYGLSFKAIQAVNT